MKTKEQLAERYIGENIGSCSLYDYYGFLAGFSAKEKIIKDLYNKYNSIRRDEEHIKLTKTIDTEKVNKLKIKLETLKELL